jgi:tetratricopeptide (TPR) repeat protein
MVLLPTVHDKRSVCPGMHNRIACPELDAGLTGGELPVDGVALDPKFIYAWLGKGDALDNLNRPMEALAAFHQALALDPKDASTWDGKIGILTQFGLQDEVRKAERQRVKAPRS